MVRLRPRHRPTAALPDGWVRPAEATAEPVVLGTLDGTARPTVDARGLVRAGRTWMLDWWAGAADRWYVPSQERPTAVAQRLVDGVPVIETSMRIPGGQLVHRAWCVRAGETDWCLVELENRSRDAVAVALAVRPTSLKRLSYEGTNVDLGVEGIMFARRPAHVASGQGATGDSAAVVLASGATPADMLDVRCGEGLANAAFVFPLAHTATLRAGIRLGGSGVVDLASLPDADAVARGWQAHLTAGCRVDVPDTSLAAATSAARSRALLAPAPAALGALDRWGHHTAADRAFHDLLAADGPRTTTEAEAAARYALLRGDGDVLDPILVAVARAAHEDRRDAAAVATIADALDLAGQHPAAARLRELRLGSTAPAWERLDDAVASASPVGTWPAATDATSVEVLDLAAHAVVIDDHDGLAVAGRWPGGWLGQPAEVHGMPSRWGRVSYAVRWHGARPALLWEVEGRPPAVRAPGLDAAWRTAEPRGEALLSPIEPAGGLPGVARPLGGRSTPVAEADLGGDFS